MHGTPQGPSFRSPTGLSSGQPPSGLHAGLSVDAHRLIERMADRTAYKATGLTQAQRQAYVRVTAAFDAATSKALTQNPFASKVPRPFSKDNPLWQSFPSKVPQTAPIKQMQVKPAAPEPDPQTDPEVPAFVKAMLRETPPSHPLPQAKPAQTPVERHPSSTSMAQKIKGFFSRLTTPQAQSGFAASSSAFASVGWGRRAMDALERVGTALSDSWQSFCEGVSDIASLGSTRGGPGDANFGQAYDPQYQIELQRLRDAQNRGGTGLPAPTIW